MKIDDLTVKKVEKKETKKPDETKVTYTTVLSKDEVTVTIKKENPIGLTEGEKGLSVEIFNTQKKLDLETPKK